MTDTQILNWIERHPKFLSYHESDYGNYWRRVFGPKDKTNQFPTLREAVVAQHKPHTTKPL